MSGLGVCCCRYDLDQRAAGFNKIKEMLLWLLGDVLEVRLSTSGSSHAGELSNTCHDIGWLLLP
jgi:hypothetical protein